ncbi:MAG: heavy metal-responsive transcriptional regulator [Candidatus Acidiferrales bacterium]
MRPGELAKQVGVSTDALRHYERLGLMPIPPRTAGGYRDYPVQALERAKLIRRALGVGLSLSDLKTILKIRDSGGVPCQSVRNLADAKLTQLEMQIKDLVAMRDQLRRVLRSWNKRLAHTPKGERARLLEILPRETVRRVSSSRPIGKPADSRRKVNHEKHNFRSTARPGILSGRRTGKE